MLSYLHQFELTPTAICLLSRSLLFLFYLSWSGSLHSSMSHITCWLFVQQFAPLCQYPHNTTPAVVFWPVPLQSYSQCPNMMRQWHNTEHWNLCNYYHCNYSEDVIIMSTSPCGERDQWTSWWLITCFMCFTIRNLMFSSITYSN